MRSILLVAALLIAPVALAAIAPGATAQAEAPSTTQVKARPFEGALHHETPVQTIVRIDYSYFALGGLAMTPTKTDVNAADVPSWAVVHVSPSTVYFPIQHLAPSGGTVQAPPQDVTITVSVTDDAPPGAVATFRILASSGHNTPIAPSSGEDSLLIQVADEEPCHHEHAADGEDVVVLAEKDADDVTTASAGIAPVGGASIVPALGAAGAVAGGAYAWQRRSRSRK